MTVMGITEDAGAMMISVGGTALPSSACADGADSSIQNDKYSKRIIEFFHLEQELGRQASVILDYV
jgi:hypothetical protein